MNSVSTLLEDMRKLRAIARTMAALQTEHIRQTRHTGAFKLAQIRTNGRRAKTDGNGPEAQAEADASEERDEEDEREDETKDSIFHDIYLFTFCRK